MIVIIDIGISNIGSVKNALNYLGIKNKISRSQIDLKNAKKIIFPGNGSFGEAMKLIKKYSLDNILYEEIINKKKPFLGICLGYQIMLKKSEESKNIDGLGWINGKVKRFKKTKKFKVPHVGWNNIKFNKMKIMDNIPNNSRFYFDHSYYTEINETKSKYGVTNHGVDFRSVYTSNNIFGCQPHPEKSQKFGLQMIKNFSELC